jgi:DNA-binding IclR family transcriptional regulator
LAVVGPSQRLSDDMIEREIVPSLLRAGEELSRRLGFAA